MLNVVFQNENVFARLSVALRLFQENSESRSYIMLINRLMLDTNEK